MAHLFRYIEDSLFALPPLYQGRASGYRRADLIGRESHYSTHASAPVRRHLDLTQLKMMIDTGLVELVHRLGIRGVLALHG